MKLALFNDFQLGVIEGSKIYAVNHELFAEEKNLRPLCEMIELIKTLEDRKEEIESCLDQVPSFSLSDVRLRQPVAYPGKILGAPVNYYSHQKEMNESHTARGMGFFLKAGNSMIGSGDTIELPYPDRRIDHELELAFVIGKTAKNVKRENAYDYIFGYTGLIDVTLRPNEHTHEERCLRKSFDTFTPVGPCIATKEEIADPDDIEMVLKVNGEVRQQINTKEMVCNVAELVEIYSRVTTLEPGDIVATGTPDGVSPIEDGDVVELEIEGIGSFSVNVSLAKQTAAL